MAETYYGPWIGIRDEWPADMPDGSEWEADLVYGRHPEPCIEWMGRMIAASGEVGAVDVNRIRRVYTPGTFTTEPRKITDPAQLGKWPLWRVVYPGAGCMDCTYTLKVAVALAEQSAVSGNRWFFVPVQMIEVSGISRAVDVPWEAVEVGNE